MDNIKLHTHPKMEEKLKIDEDHCIIDKDAYNKIYQIVEQLNKLIN